MKVYKENNGTVALRGQHSCVLETTEGISAVAVNLKAVTITAIMIASMLGYKSLTKKKLSPIL